MIFAKVYFEESFGGQDVDGQTSVPQRHAQAQFGLAFEVDLVFVDGDFQDAFERGLCDGARIQQANKFFLHSEFLEVAALEFDDDRHFFGAADGDTKLRVFELAEDFEERVDAHAEASLLESVAQFVQVEDPAVHGAAAALW